MKRDYRHRFRDPVHGFIHLSDAELRIIDTPAFQRLRNIKQLSFTYYVYPGAMHTRFEHSLGVMEMASLAFDYLIGKHRTELEKGFKSIGITTETARDILRLAGLLHDIGHLPFSHGGEAVLPEGIKHEDVSISLIRELYEETLDKNFSKDITKAIVNLIGKEEPRPELRILRNLLSGQIDVDRVDYLLRDSYYCGVDYGRFDYKRLLETISINKNDGYYDLAITRGGIHVLESMILARYFMFTQVYGHRTRRIYDLYLSDYLNLWNKGQYTKLSDATTYDDLTLLSDIRADAKGADDPAKHKLAKMIIERDHHSVVYETGDHAGINKQNVAKKVYKALQKKYGEDINLIMDDCSSTIHKFVSPDDLESGVEFNVQDDKGNSWLVTEESKVIRDMPKKFKLIRIYAYGSPKKIEAIKEHVKKTMS
ncbi:MAG: HD domain-containing protein [Nitrospirae bacterium]|nr:HD domain-containing protein [Nitrospirota bacterium]